MSPLCPFCGEQFPRGRLACPHCGSDWETGWKEEETWEGLDLPEPMDEEAYQAVLAEEGLSRRTLRRRGVPPWVVLIALLLLVSAVLAFLV